MKKFYISCGDTNGVGPEIILNSLSEIIPSSKNSRFILAIPENILQFYLKLLDDIFLSLVSVEEDPELLTENVLHVKLLKDVRIDLGYATKDSGKSSYDSLLYCLKNADNESAILTAPISKTAISKAGIDFPGHTEILADFYGCKNYAMTFLSSNFNSALYSIHIPIKNVSRSLNTRKLSMLIDLITTMAKNDLGIKEPRLAVLGLNPHSGENGLLGREEIEVIKPVISKYKENVKGPFVPDAFFANKSYKNYDFVIGIYHDQVLIPFKLMSFNKGVNYTAGLPVVRVSPDHGTAFDLAGKNLADFTPFIYTYKYANKILTNRIKNGRKTSR